MLSCPKSGHRDALGKSAVDCDFRRNGEISVMVSVPMVSVPDDAAQPGPKHVPSLMRRSGRPQLDKPHQNLHICSDHHLTQPSFQSTWSPCHHQNVFATAKRTGKGRQGRSPTRSTSTTFSSTSFGIINAMTNADAIGYAVLCIVSDCVNNDLLISGKPLTQSLCSHLTSADTKPFEEVFLTYRQGSKEDFDSNLNNVPEGCRSGICKALAYCALHERDAQSLKSMLDRCWGQMGQAFEDQAYRVGKQRGADKKAAELWKIVEESRFEIASEWKGRKSMHPPDRFDLR